MSSVALQQGAARVQPASVEPEIPPYSAADDIANGVKCYKCEAFSAKSWGSLMEHLRAKHKVCNKALAGSFLHTEGRKELADKQKERYQKRKVTKQAEGVEVDVPQVDAPGAAMAAHPQPARSARVGPEGDAQPTFWREMVGYLKCSESGEMEHPMVFKLRGLALPAGATIWAGTSSQPTSSTDAGGLADCERAPGAAESAGVSEVSPPGSGSDASGMAAMMQQLEGLAERLGGGGGDWVRGLPKVVVRQEYMECAAPSSLEESGVKASWPMKSFKSYQKKLIASNALQGFAHHLASDKNNKPATVHDHILAMQRAFHMLEVNGEVVASQGVAEDSALVAALYMGDSYKALLGLKIMGVQYSWTRKMLDGLVAFAKWQKQVATKEVLKNPRGPHSNYAAAIDQLVSSLQSGLAKRVHDEVAKRHHAKKVEDLKKIRGLPDRDAMRHAIRRAQLSLLNIARAAQGQGTTPESLLTEANQCLVGIIFLDGFAGRSQEWDLMKLSTVQAALDEGRDWLLCSTHKTSRTYGDLAKWIAPGVQEALRCYMSLPRLPGTDQLIAHARGGTSGAGINKHLFNFAAKHLPKGVVKPTVNLLRKYFHTVLMDMTQTEDKLLEVMKIIDAHSAQVARKHYVLRDPAADARLAKVLVKVALGDTVPWPSAAELKNCGLSGDGVLALPMGPYAYEEDHGQAGSGEEGDAEVEEEELEYWAGAEHFGIPQPLIPIGCAPEVQMLALEDAPLALCDVGSATPPSAGSDNKRGNLVYDKDKGVFQQVGPGPVILVHEDEVARKQTKITDFGGQPAASAAGAQSIGASSSSGQAGQDPPLVKNASHATKPTKAQKHKKANKDKKNKKGKKDKKDLKGENADEDVVEKKGVKVEAPAVQQVGAKRTRSNEHYEERPARGMRRCRLDLGETAWIEKKHDEYNLVNGRSLAKIAETSWFSSARAEGIADGVLRSFVTAEGLRSHMRTTIKKRVADRHDDGEDLD